MWLWKPKGTDVWHARWYYPPGTQSVISRTTKAKGRREAERRGAELEAEALKDWERQQAGGNVGSKRVIDEYWATEASKHKAAATHTFPHLARIDAFLGDRAYCTVSVADVARFADKLEADGMAPATINRAVSIWRRMHNVAAKTRLYPVLVIDWAQVWRQEPEPRDAQLSPDKLRLIFNGLPQRGQEIAMFALLTGCRKAQVLTLDWERVDLEAGTAKVYRKHRKAMALHTIELHDAAIAILMARRAAGIVTGSVFDVTNHRMEWDTAIEKAGAGGVRFHDLRHAFATLAAKRAPLIVVKEMLGHSDIKVTMRYAHVQRSDMRAALQAMPVLDLTVASSTALTIESPEENV